MANIILKKVILRPLEREDKTQLHKFRNDSQVTNSLGGFSVGYSLHSIEKKIEIWGQQQNTVIWAVADKYTDLCIGHIGLYDIDYISRKAEVGMLIGEKSYWGQGIGFEITQAAIDYAFNQLNLHNVQARVLENNMASLRVFEKLGFRKDGILRDFQYRDGKYIHGIHLSILESEWAFSCNQMRDEVRP